MQSSKGFTLVEVMVVIALIAIIATVATPSYQQMMESNRQTSARNNLVGALQLARSEAVIRRTQVTVSTSGGYWEVRDSGGLIRSISTSGVVTNPEQVSVTFQTNGIPQATASIAIGGRNVSVNAIGRASIESSSNQTTTP